MVNIIDFWFLFINFSSSTNQSKRFSFERLSVYYPLKILSLAIFFSYFIRKSDNDKEASEYLEENFDLDLNDDEEYLQSNKVCFIIYLNFMS